MDNWNLLQINANLLFYGSVIRIIIILIHFFFNFFLVSITTVYATKEEEEKGQESEEKENTDSIDEKEMNEDSSEEDLDMFVNLILLIIKFLLHYAFGVYLYTIAHEESSSIISIAYIIFAMISFSKVFCMKFL